MLRSTGVPDGIADGIVAGVDDTLVSASRFEVISF